MTVITHTQNNFNKGEFDWAMHGRSDLKEYFGAVAIGDNCIFWPQGPVGRRRGFAFNSIFTSFRNETTYYQKKFSITKSEEYLFVFAADGFIYIHDNTGAQLASMSHGYAASDLRSLRTVQAGQTMILTNTTGRYWPRQIRNNGSPTSWAIADITPTTYAFQRYVALTLTPGATSGAAVTMTLSGTDGYWNSGHPSGSGTKIKVNSGTATINNLQQNATGGTALASAGTAANAFDANTGTLCNAGTNGWIGYTFAGVTSIRVVGINANSSVTATIVFEAADDAAFTTNLITVGTAAGVVLTAGTVQWIDVPNYTAKTNFRMRVTNSVVLDVKDVVFNKGLVAIATVNTTLSGTGADAAWTEQFIGPGVGFPRAVAFKDDRLIFGGVGGKTGTNRLGDPSMVFARKIGDYYNFDDTAATATFAWRATVQGEGNDEILAIAPSRNGLAVFRTEGEWLVSPKGSNGITPSDAPEINRQSNDGSADIPVESIDGGLIMVSRDFKRISAFDYEFAIDSYRNEPLTLYRHSAFSMNSLPRRLTVLRNYDQTNGTMIFVPTSAGELLVCQFSADRVPAWSRWTLPNGKFLDCEVIEFKGDPNSTMTRPCLFVLATVNTNGTDKLVMGRWNDGLEENMYLDFYFRGDFDPAQTVINGTAAFAALYGNRTVRAITNGLVDRTYSVNGLGQFTLDDPATQTMVGLEYTSFIRSLPIPVETVNAKYKGNNIVFVRIQVDVQDTMDLYVNDDRFLLREMGDFLLDRPLYGVTDSLDESVNAPKSATSDRVAYWEIRCSEPVPMTITQVTRKVSCSSR